MTSLESIEPHSVSLRIENEIEAFIKKQGLKAGDRLPSERALVGLLNASRATIREAVSKLSVRGVIEVRKSGMVVGEPMAEVWADKTIITPLTPLLIEKNGYYHDVMETREALEGATCYYAAMRADRLAKSRILQCLNAIQNGHGQVDANEEARLDAAFHMAIAEASDNIILQQVMSSLFGLLQLNISQSHKKLYNVPRNFDMIFEQHQAIYKAIERNDCEGARNASNTHLDFVVTTIKQIDDDTARKLRAQSAKQSRTAKNM
ncbi:FCD domain-containing protein [Bartonella sp. HY329]|uniref:FCD domain-containing protein n=1 Tax=unclassified Bartonella TaxID=2645622 RepID=UPI0021C85F4C|nr:MULTISPECIES: FCD domain-containing protein [unclassified Bartonella]UXM95727.1 FCD domain-containing protein [Bartonella sp. HY329]UXN10052.1 FCD domain-containing protein [Bartonella sp. HY328]